MINVERLEQRSLLSAPGLVEGTYEPTEILVKFKTDAGASAVNADTVVKGSKVGRGVGADARLHKVHLPPGQSVKAALAAYANNPLVEYAEPNYVFTTQATSNDPYYTNGSLWGMYGDATSPTNQFGS